MRESRGKEVWKTVAIIGMLVAATGLGAFGFDLVTRGQLPFISDNSEVFLLAISIGFALLLVSLISWTGCLGKTGRTRIAFFILTVPLGVILIGYALGGANVHGPFFLFLLGMAPFIALGVAAAITAASAGDVMPGE